MVGVEQEAPGHGDVRQGRREAAEEVVEGIGAAEHAGGLYSLRETFGYGDGIQIPWEDNHGIRR